MGMPTHPSGEELQFNPFSPIFFCVQLPLNKVLPVSWLQCLPSCPHVPYSTGNKVSWTGDNTYSSWKSVPSENKSTWWEPLLLVHQDYLFYCHFTNTNNNFRCLIKKSNKWSLNHAISWMPMWSIFLIGKKKYQIHCKHNIFSALPVLMITIQERSAFHYNSNKNKIKIEGFAYTLNKKLQLKRIKKSHCIQIPGIPCQENTSLTVGVLHPTFLTLTHHMTHILESKRCALCRGSSVPWRVSRVVRRQCQP